MLAWVTRSRIHPTFDAAYLPQHSPLPHPVPSISKVWLSQVRLSSYLVVNRLVRAKPKSRNGRFVVEALSAPSLNLGEPGSRDFF